MRVGLEMRYISEGACGGITPLLAETLSRFFDLAPRDQFYFFGTMFNQELFSNRFPSLRASKDRTPSGVPVEREL